MHGNDECHLCIIKNEREAASGCNRVGLSTQWLSKFPDGTQEVRLIVPTRAFIEERPAAKKTRAACSQRVQEPAAAIAPAEGLDHGKNADAAVRVLKSEKAIEAVAKRSTDTGYYILY